MDIKAKHNRIIFIGIFASAAFWFLDAFIDVTFFEKDEELVESLFQPGAHEIYMRSTVLLLFLAVTIYARKMLIQLENLNKELYSHKENLEEQVTIRTEQLEKLATTDDLTQAYNRRKVYDMAEHELLRTSRYKYDLSILILDIDHFKRINDNHGHDIGDKTLTQFAQNVKNMIRQTDIFGRIGGEEFIIILPSTSIAEAKTFAERIREFIAISEYPTVGKITVSIGGAEFTDGDDIESLVKRADDALYEAKNNGRNRVIAA